MNVLEKINKLRNELGWSIYKLSEESGVLQSTLSNMFARQTDPTLSTLTAICKAFNITLKDFFDEEAENSMLDKTILAKIHQLSPKEKSAVLKLIESLLK